MKKTILTCDRCKKEVEKLIEVGAGQRFYSSSISGLAGGWKVYQLQVEWCIDCCVEMHICQPTKESTSKPVGPPPTIEDMIREIVREEMENK